MAILFRTAGGSGWETRALVGAVLTAAAFIGLALWFGHDAIFGPRQHPQTALYLAVVPDRVKLAGLDSYLAPTAAQSALSAAGYAATLRRDDDPPSSRYPPHRMATLRVENWRGFDTTGRLTLEFFNERLYEADFVPDDPAACARALHRAYTQLRRNRVGDAEWIDGNLRIASNVDLARSQVGKALHTDPYVLWQDQRLVAQRDQWDKDYGSIPIAPAK